MAVHATSTQLGRRYSTIVALVQLGAAVTGLCLNQRFAGVTYRPARDLLSFLPGNPAMWWSGLLAVAAALALLMVRIGADRHTRTAFAFLCGYWTFWVIAFACAWPYHAAGAWAPWLALMCVVGNTRPVFSPSLAN